MSAHISIQLASRTYAVVAANISTDFASVRRPRQIVKHTVKVATITMRIGMLSTQYNALIAAIGNMDEKHIATKVATFSIPFSE